MILQALVQHYKDLLARGEIAQPGWGTVKISFALYLDEEGRLTRAVSVKLPPEPGEKGAPRPQDMEMPAPMKRSAQVLPNFLWDNSSYILGVDTNGKPKRTLECFAACRALHEKLLSGVDSPAAKALLAFFKNWAPEKAAEHPALKDGWEEIISGGNLAFRFQGAYVHDDPAVRQAWQDYYDAAGEGPEMVCLVTGEKGPVEAIHPSVKGVQGAQSSGAALVSFNAPAFCSYGKEQSFNAPTSKYAAFAYTSALNHLLADRKHVCRVGDTTVVCWAEGSDPAYQEAAKCCLWGDTSCYTEEELRGMLRSLANGEPAQFDQSLLDPNRPFYILGLAPNAARLSVRFFLQNTFGGFIKNVQAHYMRLEMVPFCGDQFKVISFWRIARETERKKQSEGTQQDEEKASDGKKQDKRLCHLANGICRSIFLNSPYPVELMNLTLLRIYMEKEINWIKAAILKAYILQNGTNTKCKEIASMSLEKNSDYFPYVWGRIFSIFEDIQVQSKKIDDPQATLNTTIKDRFYKAAATTPEIVYPTLEYLKNSHMEKIRKRRPELSNWYHKQLMDLFSRLSVPFPKRLNSEEQVAFNLGYYHQTQQRYTTKEEKENV